MLAACKCICAWCVSVVCLSRAQGFSLARPPLPPQSVNLTPALPLPHPLLLLELCYYTPIPGGLLNPGTSYLRYRGDYILPATHLPAAPQGPAVWRVSGPGGLSVALNNLLQEPLERRSRGHAAAQVCTFVVLMLSLMVLVLWWCCGSF